MRFTLIYDGELPAGDKKRARKPLEPHELDKIATATLAHYEQHAEEFRAGTRDHDVSQNIASLLRHIEGESPFTILDFGCGPGRDLKTLAGLGHTAIGLEGACRLCCHGACRHRVRSVAAGFPQA